MEDHQYSERVEAVLARSVLAEGFVLCAAVATGALVACLPVALEAQAGALAWIAASGIASLRRLRPGRRLRLDAEGGVEVCDVRGELRDGSFVAPWLAVVRWRPPDAWSDRALLVAPDMLAPEDFRRVRVILRWRK